MRLKHVALHVPDLERAEAFYVEVFGVAVVTREAVGADGVWKRLPAHASWGEARAADVTIQMIGLARDGLVIAVFPGEPQPGTLYLVGVDVNDDEIAEVRARLPADATIEVDETDALTFVDPFGFRWQLSGPAFRGAPQEIEL